MKIKIPFAVVIGLSYLFGPSLLGSPGPYRPGSPEVRKIIGKNNLEPIETIFGTELYELTRPIARIEVGDGNCTGFAIGKNLVMTNHHCLTRCEIMKARFYFEKGIEPAQQILAPCEKIEAKDKNLDFIIMRLKGEGTDSDSIPFLPLDIRRPMKDQLLAVAGHPMARAKEIDRSRDCKFLFSLNDSQAFVTHSCDTESGNSGSPILDPQERSVIAIHWGYSESNRGTWMRAIVEYLKKFHPTLLSELIILQD